MPRSTSPVCKKNPYETLLTDKEAESPNQAKDESDEKDALSNVPGGDEVASEYLEGDEQLHPLVKHAKPKHHKGSDKVDYQNLVIL